MSTANPVPTLCDCCCGAVASIDSVWLVPMTGGPAVACGEDCARALRLLRDMVNANTGKDAAGWQEVARDYASLARSVADSARALASCPSIPLLAVGYQRCAWYAAAEASIQAGAPTH